MRKFAFAVAAFAVVLSAAEWLLGMYLADGAFTYPLDDAYIHLALARNIAENGTWGIEKGVPVFASSSPLYPHAAREMTILSGSDGSVGNPASARALFTASSFAICSLSEAR